MISFIAIPDEAHQICMVNSQKKINLRQDPYQENVEIYITFVNVETYHIVLTGKAK